MVVLVWVVPVVELEDEELDAELPRVPVVTCTVVTLSLRLTFIDVIVEGSVASSCSFVTSFPLM